MAEKSEYLEIDLNKLFLDNENPRLPKSSHKKTEKEIIDYLLLEASTIELMQAIGENDYFRGEQLLVVEETENKYKVVEGNRRLVSLKLLQKPELASVKKKLVKQVYVEAKYKPTKIPCLIFDSEDEIRKYLGFRHITGIKSWGLSEKARFLNQLYEKYFEKESLVHASRELAKMIGSRQDYVKRLLIAFKIYEYIEDQGFFRIKGLDDTTFYVGYLSDSLSKTNIASYLGIDISIEDPLINLNNDNVKQWTRWFYEKNPQNKTRLKGKSDDLNKLNAILGNKLAKNSFIVKESSLSVAYDLSEDINTIFKRSIEKALSQLELADSLTHKVTDFNMTIESELIEIRKLTSKIKQAKDDFTKPKFDNDEF